MDSQLYTAFRKAIMADIDKHSIRQESELKQLFLDWLAANPIEFHSVLLQVISDIELELGVEL